jgi:hypothetical protein
VRHMLEAMTVIATCAVLFLLMTFTARSHDWYPPACCSDKDCEEVPAPTEGGGGFIFPDGRSVLYRAVQPSPDGAWHLCERQWPAEKSQREILCVFGPVGGS